MQYILGKYVLCMLRGKYNLCSRVTAQRSIMIQFGAAIRPPSADTIKCSGVMRLIQSPKNIMNVNKCKNIINRNKCMSKCLLFFIVELISKPIHVVS